jgi:hypothetical protein
VAGFLRSGNGDHPIQQREGDWKNLNMRTDIGLTTNISDRR